jgi:hypothetical protein
MMSTARILPLPLGVAVFVAIACAPPPLRAQPPASAHTAVGGAYEDITVAAGLAGFRHLSGDAGKRYLIDETGSGAAIWDYDNDGLADIYLLNGSTLDRLRSGRAAPPAALFRNRGDGTFTDVTAAAGLANERWGQGVCVGDIDNDGFEDVYVTNFGKNRLYRYTRAGRFEDIAERAGVAVDSWSTGCAFGDFDGDGWLDLFVAGYATLDVAHLPPASAPASASAAASASALTPGGRDPRGLAGAPDHLFRNNHDGTFADVSAAAGVADTEGRHGFGVAWFDADDDGWIDLFVANDAGANYLYRNGRNGRFEEITDRSGAALDAGGLGPWRTGAAIGDYDNDGRLDPTPRGGGGVAVGDLDNDGALDIVINTLDGPPIVARHRTASGSTRGHWLTLRLHGDPRRRAPRDAIGAIVIITTADDHRRIRGEVASGRGHLSQSDLRVHLGLGDATAIDTIEVRWPNGAIIIYPGGPIDTIMDIDQATGPRRPII